MNFSQDYTKFFDLNTKWTPDPTKKKENYQIWERTKGDFTINLTLFLEHHDILFETASAIAHALFERMADRRLHYHTPVHVLSMFQFAQREFPDQKLLPWEELAIWFHDSVYIPQMPGTSEDLSVMFMRAMVDPAFSENEMAAAQYAIETTAQHLEAKTNSLYDTVMDLDLASAFLGDMTTRNAAIREEFDYIDDAAFNQGRKSFFNRLISKGFIFRSDLFKERYETQAMENIKKELGKLEKGA